MHPLHPMFVPVPIALLSASVAFDPAVNQWKPEMSRSCLWPVVSAEAWSMN